MRAESAAHTGAMLEVLVLSGSTTFRLHIYNVITVCSSEARLIGARCDGVITLLVADDSPTSSHFCGNRTAYF